MGKSSNPHEKKLISTEFKQCLKENTHHAHSKNLLLLIPIRLCMTKKKITIINCLLPQSKSL